MNAYDWKAAPEAMLRARRTSELIVSAGALIRPADGYTLAVLAEPMKCPACETMAAFVVNRNGSTLCSSCDSKRVPWV